MDNSGKLLGAQINREWFLYQEKEVFAEYRQKRLTIGLPNETERRENRVCLTPEAVAMMVDMGHTIMVQRGAGEAAHYHDREYADAGAQMLDTCEEVYTADIILKPTPVMQADVEMMHDRQVIMSPIELFELRKEAVVEMMQKMSEISGSSAIMIASEYLSNSREGKGILLGGVTGITPAEVVILGAGTLGEYAARTALALGAEVKVFDHSLERLRRINHCLGRRVYTSVFHKPVLERALLSADVLIGALRFFDDDLGITVSEEQVRLMKQGAVIVDMSIEHGGCIETSGPTTHENPTYVYNGVIHYCVPNVPSRVARTASIAYSNLFTPLFDKISRAGGFNAAIKNDKGLRHGVYVYNGVLTKRVIADRYGLVSRDIDLLLAAF